MGVAAVAMVLALADMVQWSWYFMWAITGWLLMVIEVVLLVAGMLMQHTK